MSNDKQNCVTIYIDARYAAASSRDAIRGRNMQQLTNSASKVVHIGLFSQNGNIINNRRFD